jgi:hypothetical protein
VVKVCITAATIQKGAPTSINLFKQLSSKCSISEEQLTFQDFDELLPFGYLVRIRYIEIISLREMKIAKLIWSVLIRVLR